MSGSKQMDSVAGPVQPLLAAIRRRYHALLMAATVPPAERMSLVSKLDETLIINHERFELSTNDYGDVIHPSGYQHLTSFCKNLFPRMDI